MRVAIVAEGRGDLAVITNILKGKLGIYDSEIDFLLPKYEVDYTDRAKMDQEYFSNWTLVKEKCINRKSLETYFDVYDDAFLIIQIDTAERGDIGYEVQVPKKTENQETYCLSLRNNVIDKINEWLENNFKGNIAYAVCIEETEAWIMTLYGEKETSKSAQPKENLNKILNKKLSKKDISILSKPDEYEKMKKLSIGFSKKKILSQVQKNNKSLDLFCNSLDSFK